tara:strand:- start:1431 stop:1730 length:300 start_codon:yes stop_codon:yes gene_type:complete
MRHSLLFDLDKCSLSNELWPDFVNQIGILKAKLAVNQALDLQRMQGTSSTLPILILETCGTALANSQLVMKHIGLSYVEQGMLLIYSNKFNAIQLLIDN